MSAHRFDHHPPCRCGCGQLADECAGPRPNPLGSIRLHTPISRHQPTGHVMTELNETLRQTVSRLAAVLEQKSTLEVEEKVLKTEIRSHIHTGDQGTVNGHPVISVSPNRRFSSDLAAATLPPEIVRLCTVTKIDSATAKKNLPPTLYEQCMAEVGEPVVRVL